MLLRSICRITILLIVTISMASCIHKGADSNRALAKVYDKFLYLSDVQSLLPKGTSKADSIKILSAYVDQWVRRNLLLHLSESNLTEEQKNVSKQLEDYRLSLLIFKFEQEYILQKLDTSITKKEISDFYNENLSNFTLSETIVKALYIKVRSDNPYLDKFKELYKSSKDEDIKALDNIAYQAAEKYDYFGDKWLPFNLLQRQFPYALENFDDYLRQNRSIEMEDGDFKYFINIRLVMFAGQTSPLEYETENIKSVIINKRKQKLISDLENNIYNDAMDHKNFQIFL
ncbi:MAG: hypothetical protein AB9846_09000 [Tenuifilaceae bacterium]